MKFTQKYKKKKLIPINGPIEMKTNAMIKQVAP